MLNPDLRHRHLIVRANIENPLVGDAECDEWFRTLIKQIDMEIMIGPFSHYLPDEGNRGRTVLIGIKTSSITAHIWDEVSPAVIALDVYSCKDFEIQTVFDHLATLGSSNIKYKFIDREDDLIEVASGSF